jgi:hypothetical protein
MVGPPPPIDNVIGGRPGSACPVQPGKGWPDMKWSEAKTRALEEWQAIQDSIGTAPVDELLREINAMNELCDKAEEDSTGGARCAYCAAYQQFGDCSEITAKMSHYVAEKDWEKVRELAATFMERLRSIEVAPGT